VGASGLIPPQAKPAQAGPGQDGNLPTDEPSHTTEASDDATAAIDIEDYEGRIRTIRRIRGCRQSQPQNPRIDGPGRRHGETQGGQP